MDALLSGGLDRAADAPKHHMEFCSVKANHRNRAKHSMNIGLFNPAGNDRPFLAIGLLLIATFTLAFQDGLMKLMSGDTSFWQIQTLRSFGNLTFTIILAGLSGGYALLRPRNTPAVLLRAVFLAVCMFCFFSGAPYLSVAQMGAGLYTYPLFVSLLAGPVLGESIGPWRILSLCIGTVGAALMLSPWRDDFTAVQIMPILAGFFYACNILSVRKFCRHESTLALAFVAAMVFLVSGTIGILLLTFFPLPIQTQQALPFVAVAWPTLTLTIAGFAVFVSVLNLTGNICISRAYQTADASLLAPLDFSYLIFVALWGKVLFDRWPESHTLLGMVLIILAGSTIAWREHRINTKKTQNVVKEALI